MREILFRGKRVDNGTWAYGDLLHCDDEMEIDSESLGENGGYIIPETVGQYTGLKDLHGTRIFEGDVVRFNSNKANLIVNFSEFSWELLLPNKKYYRYWLSDADNKRLEVVGNIFDNPELLEGDKT